MKFGGTSMAGTERIRRVAQIVRKQQAAGHEVAVVVSAMAGETDRLVNFCREANPLYDPAEYDVVVASGEQVTSGLLALTLQAMRADLIVIRSPHSGARWVEYDLENDRVIVSDSLELVGNSVNYPGWEAGLSSTLTLFQNLSFFAQFDARGDVIVNDGTNEFRDRQFGQGEAAIRGAAAFGMLYQKQHVECLTVPQNGTCPPDQVRATRTENQASLGNGERNHVASQGAYAASLHPGSQSARKAPHSRGVRLLCARPHLLARVQAQPGLLRLVGVGRPARRTVEVITARRVIVSGVIHGLLGHFGLAPNVAESP